MPNFTLRLALSTLEDEIVAEHASVSYMYNLTGNNGVLEFPGFQNAYLAGSAANSGSDVVAGLGNSAGI